jgi:hypothetical protein
MGRPKASLRRVLRASDLADLRTRISAAPEGGFPPGGPRAEPA